MIRLALRSALSDRASDGKIIVLDGWGIEEPSNWLLFLKALDALGIIGRASSYSVTMRRRSSRGFK